MNEELKTVVYKGHPEPKSLKPPPGSGWKANRISVELNPKRVRVQWVRPQPETESMV